ncbi:MAG: tetratricopeptide repeat protein [Deltaproteobacteria bacterium]|nr:tetratricopeptide repeat protein [Deltaproteobacteria bacterium]
MDTQAYESGKRELKDLLGVDAAALADLRGRAQFFLDKGSRERALIMLEMLEALDRTDPASAILAAEQLIALGRSGAAQEKIERVLARAPDHADALVALAQAKIAAGELAPAAELIKRVLARDPDGRTPAGRRALAVTAQAKAKFGA